MNFSGQKPYIFTGFVDMFDEDFVAISDTGIVEGEGEGDKKLGQTEAKVPQLSISQSAGSEVRWIVFCLVNPRPLRFLTCNTLPSIS